MNCSGLKVFTSKPDGTFSSKDFFTGSVGLGVIVGNFTADELLDVVVAAPFQAQFTSNRGVWLRIGNGTGDFPTTSALRAGNSNDVAAGDFNRDGVPNVVTTINSTLN